MKPPEATGDRVVSSYGVASTVLGLLSVAAVVLLVVIWSSHRSDVTERRYLSRVMQTAVDWTGVLINMTADNVDASLRRLHDGTVGELNVDFDSAVQPYRQVVQQLKSRSAGRIEAVAAGVGASRSGRRNRRATSCAGAGGAPAGRHPHRPCHGDRHLGGRGRRRQTHNRALESAARRRRRRGQNADLAAGVDPMRRRTR